MVSRERIAVLVGLVASMPLNLGSCVTDELGKLRNRLNSPMHMPLEFVIASLLRARE